jgi:hypothetical protein
MTGGAERDARVVGEPIDVVSVEVLRRATGLAAIAVTTLDRSSPADVLA